VTAYEVAASVVDPELRVVTIEELGILRGVEKDHDRVVVTVTPTYSGCPAMDVIRADLTRALAGAGYPGAEIRTVLRPPWTTDMITERGRAKLAAAGIAPPTGTAALAGGPVALRLSVACPRCGSLDTQELARFGSTACKALWRCRACGEPFDHVKPM
jgi:ring-1,2-phenylacetyl-CoA epoxidase subunit PaaD